MLAITPWPPEDEPWKDEKDFFELILDWFEAAQYRQYILYSWLVAAFLVSMVGIWSAAHS